MDRLHPQSALLGGDGPAIAETLTINVQMWTVNFLVIRVPVRCASEVKPGKNDYAARPSLVCALSKFDLTARNVKHEEFAPVKALQGNAESATKSWIIVS
jgi:hypothetical protein